MRLRPESPKDTKGDQGKRGATQNGYFEPDWIIGPEGLFDETVIAGLNEEGQKGNPDGEKPGLNRSAQLNGRGYDLPRHHNISPDEN